MSTRPALQHPMKHARNFGSAKNGTHHFIVQRISAVVLALLAPWIVCLLISLIPADYETVRETLSHPVRSIFLLSFLIALFWHTRMGLQVVIDDYIHNKGLCLVAQIFVLFACSLGGLVSILAIGRLFFAV